MRLFMITGRPGTGKSYITSHMANQGYAAYDLEEIPNIIRVDDIVTQSHDS